MQGIQGIQGEAGPNEVTTTTATNITGLLKGNGTNVQQAVAGEDYQAPLPNTTNNNGKFLGIKNSALAWIDYIIAGAAGGLTINSGASGNVGLIVQGVSGQAADLQQWTNSEGNVIANVLSNGDMHSTARFSTASGMINDIAKNNAYVNVASTGTIISRNVADANAALTVNQANSASMGNIFDLKFNSILKANFDKDGILTASGYKSSDGSIGVDGSFTTNDGKTVTVKNGLITAMV